VLRKKVIFDLGANQGQNLGYFLDKADKVVAVEANPLCISKYLKIFKGNSRSTFICRK
jgi:FkbM family methyltransferase